MAVSRWLALCLLIWLAGCHSNPKDNARQALQQIEYPADRVPFALHAYDSRGASSYHTYIRLSVEASDVDAVMNAVCPQPWNDENAPKENPFAPLKKTFPGWEPAKATVEWAGKFPSRNGRSQVIYLVTPEMAGRVEIYFAIMHG